jgi:AraC-like DNA-binding protein
MVTIQTHRPASILGHYIERYLVIETTCSVTKAIPPQPSFTMTFRSRGQHRYSISNIEGDLPSVTLTGIRKTVKYNTLGANSQIIIVVFTPWGAASFFGEPMNYLSKVGIHVDDLTARSKVEEVEERLVESENTIQSIQVIERFLLSMLQVENIDPLALTAINRIQASRGTARMTDLASSLNVSLDVLEKRFRKIVGASPKQFSSTVRLARVLKEKQNHTSLTNMAIDLGYFDQSHFIKEFKLFTGQTPSAYFNLAERVDQ